jgi:hypothetical protein
MNRPPRTKHESIDFPKVHRRPFSGCKCCHPTKFLTSSRWPIQSSECMTVKQDLTRFLGLEKYRPQPDLDAGLAVVLIDIT